MVVGIKKSCGAVPGSMTHLPDLATIFVTLIDCEVSTPV